MMIAMTALFLYVSIFTIVAFDEGMDPVPIVPDYRRHGCRIPGVSLR